MTETKHSYRPLPDSLTIKESEIHGLGLFAVNPYAEGLGIGISHIRDERFPNSLIRTPLGGFINNNTEDPNIKMVPVLIYDCTTVVPLIEIADINPDGYVFVTTREIKSGEELTINYLKTPCLDECSTDVTDKEINFTKNK